MLRDSRFLIRFLAAAVCAVLAGTFPGKTMAEPIGLMERFALAEDREAVLSELIPGSDDHYFYHCLHFQNTRQLDRSEAMLKQWVDSKKGSLTALMQSMTDRQRLLTYDQTPQQTIDYFVRRLGIQLNHAAPARKGARRYPSVLDENSIRAEQLVKDSLRNNTGLSPAGMQIAADWYLNGQANQIRLSLKDFLKRVEGPYLRDLSELVISELRSRPPRDQRFGDLPAHRFLTRDELERVGQAIPAVTDDNEFVYATLRTLRPGADVDLSQQPRKRREYLARVESYTRTLPSAYNSLKASATYRLLEANLQFGIWDKALFLRYLSLPRQSPIISRDYNRSSSQANLREDFSKVALLPPIGNEQPLVETYLEHFLRDARNPDEFARYLQADFLRRVFARTKLMAGVANPQPYYDMLSASERQQLRDKVQLSFAAENPARYGTDDPTELLVDVKNIDKLVVRIYEMNSLAFHRTNEGRLDTDVELDGLIATEEKTIEYDRPAIVRHRERLTLPEINGRGAWIVDLVGEGLRARTLIRRGDLHTVQAQDANGMQFTVLNEARQPVAGAKLYVGNQEFTAGDDGRVFLPMVNKAVQRTAIVSDGKLARKIRFTHLEEDYSLQAGFFVDRTLLQTGRTAELLIRPQLTLGHTVVDPSILKSVSVRILATDLEGIQTTRQFDDLELDQASELALKFRVPPRAARFEFELSGTVVGLSDRRERQLSVKHAVDVSGIRRTAQTVDAYLTRDGGDFVLETRGRSGELVSGAMVQVELFVEIGDIHPRQYLQSDEKGQVRLGELSGVRELVYGIAGQTQHRFDVALDRQVWPAAVHLAVDEALRLPLVDGRSAKSFRLLRRLDGNAWEDVSDRLELDDGFLVGNNLPAGDLELIDRLTGNQTSVVVVEGPTIDRVLVGQTRHRETNPALPLSIGSITRQNDGSITVQLTGNTDLARVHAVSTRFFDQLSPIDQLNLDVPALRGRRVSLSRCGYVSDLRLGDEYEYVLRRQYAAKYPGVMLPQPSVLLNPWETETTSNESQKAEAGERPMASAAEADSEAMDSGMAQRKQAAAAILGSEFDFLSDSGVLAANLVPDANGRITIPAEMVDGLPIVQLVVASPITLLKKTVTAPLQTVETEDLRLAKSLPKDAPLSFERVVSIVSGDDPLDLETLGSAQVQVYGDVASLMTYYRTMINDDRLDDFQTLAQWHLLPAKEKLQQYSELASHELHLFLKMHDGEFFDSVVRPYLQNKKEKQFVDRWLLDQDLSEYATLWKYQQLSSAERALLAIRMPSLRDSIVRDLRDAVAAQEEDYAGVRRQIESALRASRMSTMEELEGLELKLSESAAMQTEGEAAGIGGFADFAAPAAPSSRAMGRGLGQQTDQLRRTKSADKANAAFFGLRNRALMEKLGFYQELDSTKQWAESNWDRVRVVGGPPPMQLVPINAFWRDLAGNDGGDDGISVAVSENLLRCVDNRHAALVALAMCGLPLESGEIGLPAKPETVYRPQHPVALVTKRLRDLKPADGESTVLIGQLFRSVEAKSAEDQAFDESNQFETGRAYQGQVVVSNPTAGEQLVELFWQIPAGSVPLGGSQVTDSKTIKLAPFAVSSVSYQFYFPSAGEFGHYPATVSRDGQLLAQGDEKTFTVLDDWTDDSVTWQSIARDGTADQIKQFLQNANLHELDFGLVLHRLRDRSVYEAVTSVLAGVRLPEQGVWGYGFHHRDVDAMRHFLALREDVVNRVGPSLESTLLSVDAIERHRYEHLEYAPLVRARIHRLGDVDEILNPTFLAQYRQFTRRLGFRSQIEPAEKLSLVYYLLLQNRIEQAIKVFKAVDPERIASRLQYDYLAGYLSLHQGEYQAALQIASEHQNHPVPRWKARFDQMALHVRQRFELMDAGQLVSAGGDDPKAIDQAAVSTTAADLAIADRERANSRASAAVPEVIIRVEGDSVRIDHRNTDQVDINLYGVDLELLFSKAPFARSDLERIAMVRPTRSTTLTMTSKTGTFRFPIPEDLQSGTLLVEGNVGASRSTTLYYGGGLTTYVSEAFGQLQTTDAVSHRPVAGAYVKVYAKYPDGDVRFFKDGYTDGRGRFDYTSISAGDAKGAQRFAILVLSETNGATLHDVKAP
jgi:hypothetical protein